MNIPKIQTIPAIRVRGGFWRQKADVVANEMVPYQWLALNDLIPGAEPSHAVENFRIAAGEVQGSYAGNVWQDSDVAKWLEAASYVLADHEDPELEAHVDEAIDLIEKSQQPDGYINTWFTLVSPEKRWTDLAWSHELYCGGHLIEAAVAHFHATGSRKFLDVMARFADGLIPVFGEGGPHSEDSCGHPEIELALHRLAEATGKRKYADLACRFVDVRGRHPERFLDKKPLGFEMPVNAWYKPDYFLEQVPVREQHQAEGHAVRAMYLYTAMAKQAMATGDAQLKAVLADLWSSVADRRLYITGGLGSHAEGERFTLDYDLPSDTAYTETCASIGFVFWARAMLDLEPKGIYADEMERALFNGALSGMALDGKRFFYVNPLEVIPSVVHRRQDLKHVKTERVAWLGCACCPPNIARLVGSIGSYAWACDGDTVRVDQYVDSEALFTLGGTEVGFTLTTLYPWEGNIEVAVRTLRPQKFALSLRVPGWCKSFTVRVAGKVTTTPLADGYATLDRTWNDGDLVQLELAMPVRILSGRPEVAELAGKVAVSRGPLIFCAEEVDNGPELHNLCVDPSAPTTAQFYPSLMGGSVKVTVSGCRRGHSPGRPLYSSWEPVAPGGELEIVLVPYHQWGNRRPGQEMRVWLRAAPIPNP